MTLKISKSGADIMLNDSQESWSSTVDDVKVSDIGYLL